MNHAIKAIAHENKIRRVAYFYSAAARRSRGALWPSFAPALISEDVRSSGIVENDTTFECSLYHVIKWYWYIIEMKHRCIVLQILRGLNEHHRTCHPN
jgi:hypothetical protein